LEEHGEEGRKISSIGTQFPLSTTKPTLKLQVKSLDYRQ